MSCTIACFLQQTRYIILETRIRIIYSPMLLHQRWIGIRATFRIFIEQFKKQNLLFIQHRLRITHRCQHIANVLLCICHRRKVIQITASRPASFRQHELNVILTNRVINGLYASIIQFLQHIIVMFTGLRTQCVLQSFFSVSSLAIYQIVDWIQIQCEGTIIRLQHSQDLRQIGLPLRLKMRAVSKHGAGERNADFDVIPLRARV
mmetsp:Transcript_32347/g.51869  ORF Transcript_32347/g.51869 Transcript_32347/m.51869 type:complete len:205 (-) Transcript_32347:349-963(-)